MLIVEKTCELIPITKEDKRRKSGVALRSVVCSECGTVHSGGVEFLKGGEVNVYRFKNVNYCHRCGAKITNDVMDWG